ncbi:PhoH family protein [Miniphocaeibacter halophilus]|uniref:PhoH family protein n=1 Tax=Miniphocaeibacter halophilus TaxID=2931922 RepID=A0AC61MU65_9FIRM|nr:PhoH family protein [Miniphocaeibacter halophilus]QQK07676.1 PhoH family protein [Miniphocaeibacter halophilus]
MEKVKFEFEVTNQEFINILFDNLEEKIKLIEKELNVKLSLYGNGIKIIGNKNYSSATYNLLIELYELYKKDGNISEQQVRYLIDMIKKGKNGISKTLLDYIICTTSRGKPIKPKTLGQKQYLDYILSNDIVFGVGPAGTGKTYLAMAMAIRAFKNNEVDRIILTRPAVEAGESLGFLPGDLQEKIDPYLRPIYDALFEILGYEQYLKLVEKGLIEVAPLAYMRGRTLDNAYVVLDEAQNTTNEQMKMFLTRIGYGSKAIITGDITQIDLPRGKKSGLKNASNILRNIDGIAFMDFESTDIVRHPLVQKIINAYEKFELKENKNGNINK